MDGSGCSEALGWANLLVAATSVGVGYFVARLTREMTHHNSVMAQATKAQAEVSTRLEELTRETRRPAVHIDLDVEGNEVTMTVFNNGANEARDVRFSVSAPEVFKVWQFTRLPVSTDGIAYLPPGGKRVFVIGWLTGRVFELPPKPFDIAWSYADKAGRIEDSATFDLRVFTGRVKEKDPIVEVAKELRTSNLRANAKGAWLRIHSDAAPEPPSPQSDKDS